ncbi:hypothetical protein C5F52_02170 [Limnohabitans sp. TS-CS-82]|uniref:hypothetical protein n=1 Tax=Limnohabitans sp. TS-CS-82 TaxID=2094193 RepID=UPI000CF29AD7|nr:hypothetical protein [Limnohabitans sp. TS-CS-82]PQA84830.1 hypothetical protein C5F52_02170 [Limnohabitans sp. TS-CS-82]
MQSSLRNSPVKLRISLFAMAISVSAFVVIFYYREKFNFYATNALASAGLVYALYLIKLNHIRFLLYLIISLWCGLVLWKIDLDQTIISIGQNGITLHFLILYVVYFFRVHFPLRDTRTLLFRIENYLFAAVLFTLAVWSQGRSAAGAALIVLCVATCILMGEFDRKRKYWVIAVSLAIVFFNYYSPVLMGERSYSAIDRVAISGVSDVRFTLWVDYFKSLTPEGLFMGNRDSNCHNILVGYSRENCNIHSSYLRAHQAYGLSGVVMIVVILFLCFRRLLKLREWFAIFICMALLARVATDEAFFTTPYLAVVFFVYSKVMGDYSSADGRSGE